MKAADKELDTDDATIEEARRADVFGNDVATANRILALIDIATRRGEEIGLLKITNAAMCDMIHVMEGRESVAKSERDALAEENKTLRRQFSAGAAISMFHHEKEIDALAEQVMGLREALDYISAFGGEGGQVARAALSRGGE